MDFQLLMQNTNDALNRALQETVAYFSNLNQNEIYGWATFSLGLILFIVGWIIW